MKEKKRARPLAAILFCLVLAAGLMGLLFLPKEEYSPLEKRYLAQFPELTAERFFDGTFGEEFEEYLSDHFPGRGFFVGCYSYFNLLCGNNGANGVYYGSDSYLIREPVAPEDSQLETNLDALAQLVENTGLPTTLLAVPSTGYIYSDKLPAAHETYEDDLYFSQITQRTEGTISFVDLRETFLAEKDNTSLYYRTDHHWTTQGAYLAYRELCPQLGLEPLAEADFTVETVPGFKGTTSSTSGFYLVPADEIQVWHNQAVDANVRLETWEGSQCETSDALYFQENAAGEDKYTLFLDGNHSLQYVYNDGAEGGTLLLVQDSYAHCLTPFLAAHYKKIVIVDPRYYKLPVSQLAVEEGAEQVLVLYGMDNLCTDVDIPWLS